MIESSNSIEKLCSNIPRCFYSENFNSIDHTHYASEDLLTYKNILDKIVTEKIVKENYQHFYQSTTSFSSILSLFSESQKLVTKLQSTLQESKTLLLTSNQEVIQKLCVDSKKYKEIQSILDLIEALLQVPSLIQQYMEKQQYIHSVSLIRCTLNLLACSLYQISVLSEIQEQILSLKQQIGEKLIEELQNWVYYIPQEQTLFYFSDGNEDVSFRYSTLHSRSSFQSSGSFDSDDTLSQADSKSSICNTLPKEEEELIRPTFQNKITEELSHNLLVRRIYEDIQKDTLIKEELHSDYLSKPFSSEKFHLILFEAISRLDRLPSAQSILKKTIKDHLNNIINQTTEKYQEQISYEVFNNLSSAEFLTDLLERIFSLFIGVLKKHIQIFRIFQEKLSSKNDSTKDHYNSGYNLINVWEDIQNQVETILCMYLSTHPSKASNKPITVNDNLTESFSLSFSFEASLEQSIVTTNSLSSSSSKEEKGSDIHKNDPDNIFRYIKPTPYNITVLYRPTITFIDQCLSMLGNEVNQSSHLRDFINNFIQSTLLPRIRADAFTNVFTILSNPNLFSKNQLWDPEGFYTPVFQSAFEIAKLVQKVFSDLYLLPSVVTEFSSIIEPILYRFFEKCSEQYQYICKKLWSSTRISDNSSWKILSNDPLYLALSQAHNVDIDSSKYFLEEIQIYHQLHNDICILNHSQLMWEQEHWTMLAMISISLNWLIDEVHKLASPLSLSVNNINTQNFVLNQPQDTKFDMVHIKNKTRSSWKKSIRRTTQSPLFGPHDLLFDSFRHLADNCLFTLKVELYAHCYYHLKNFQNQNYSLEFDQKITIDSFILDLNNDINHIEDRLASILFEDQMIFLFSRFPQFISTIFISYLPKVKNNLLNKFGLSQIHRNLLAIQQNLTSILVSRNISQNDESFEKAHHYLDLLTFNHNELEIFQKANPNLFTSSEYNALFNIQLQ